MIYKYLTYIKLSFICVLVHRDDTKTFTQSSNSFLAKRQLILNQTYNICLLTAKRRLVYTYKCCKCILSEEYLKSQKPLLLPLGAAFVRLLTATQLPLKSLLRFRGKFYWLVAKVSLTCSHVCLRIFFKELQSGLYRETASFFIYHSRTTRHKRISVTLSFPLLMDIKFRALLIISITYSFGSLCKTIVCCLLNA